MAKVAQVPDEDAPFPCAVYGTDVTAFDPAYLKRKKELREEICELPGGKKICIFRDGPDDGVPVFCFHGGCECKWKFVQKEPLPGILLIGVDRPGYGKSYYPDPFLYDFHNAVEDIVALADHLQIDKFVCMGHSIGTSWCHQIAAGAPDRVMGTIVWSSMVDPKHPKLTPKTLKAIAGPEGLVPSILHPKRGCCGCILRGAFGGIVKSIQKGDFKGAFGREMKHTPARFDQLKADPFWVSSIVDSMRGFTDPRGIYGDADRTLTSKWTWNLEEIKCPVYLYHGDKDYDMMCTAPAAYDFLTEVIPNAHLEIIPDVAHTLVLGPNEETRDRILKAVAWIQKQAEGAATNASQGDSAEGAAETA